MERPKKAELVALGAEPNAGPVGDPIKVQFNPTSLRLQMANSIEGGDASARQARQYNGTSSTTLTVDLVFDTADEGTSEQPVSVKTRSSQVAQFLLPGEGSQEPPPRVRFHWGDFILDGVMSAMTEDIDLFSSDGVPLRSKVNITIKEQDPRLTGLEVGPGTGNGDQRNEPGGGGAGPGAQPGGGPGDRSREALGGESPAEFAARNGLAPEAWRAVADSLDGLDLPIGAEIGFSTSASASVGIGAFTGFAAGADAPLAAQLGIEMEPGTDVESGFNLASAGGINAALAIAENAEVAASSNAAREAFGAPASSPAATAAAAGSGPAVLATGQQAPAASAAVSSRTVDPRASSFGRGVPLRPRRGLADLTTVGTKQEAGVPPTTTDRTVPGWEALPTMNGWLDATADSAARDRGPSPCGHRRRCRCGGHS